MGWPNSSLWRKNKSAIAELEAFQINKRGLEKKIIQRTFGYSPCKEGDDLLGVYPQDKIEIDGEVVGLFWAGESVICSHIL